MQQIMATFYRTRHKKVVKAEFNALYAMCRCLVPTILNLWVADSRIKELVKL